MKDSEILGMLIHIDKYMDEKKFAAAQDLVRYNIYLIKHFVEETE